MSAYPPILPMSQYKREDDDDDFPPHIIAHRDSEPHELAPLPTIPRPSRAPSRTSRPSASRQSSTPTVPLSATVPSAPFAPLTHTSSRLSQRSVQTFVDAPALVAAIPALESKETVLQKAPSRIVADVERAGNGGNPGTRDGDADEKVVAVEVNEAGEVTYPDGGKEAWLVLFGGFLSLFCGFGLTAGLGGFQTYYRTYLLSDYSSSTIAWLTGCQAFVTFVITVFTGSLFDKFGCKPLMATGTVLATLGYCMLSLCSQYWQLCICHVTLIPFGINLLFISPVGVVSQWFYVKRGIAFGILMSGASIGAMVWPLILANLPQRIGFGWTCRLIALIVLIIGTTGFFLLKTRLPPKPPGPFFYLKACRSLPYCCIAISSFTYVFAFFDIMNFIGTYGQIMEIGPLALYLLIILNGSSGVGRLTFGFLADKLGPYNVTCISVVVLAVFNWAWILFTTGPALIGLSVVFGFWSGAYVALQAPMTTMLATDMRFAGTMVGQVLFFQSFSQLSGPPIFGALLGHGTLEEQRASAPHAIILGATMMTLTVFLLVLARFWLERKLWAKV